MATTGTFTSTGNSDAFVPAPAPYVKRSGSIQFNFTLWGTFVATVVIQRSFDAGATWVNVSKDSSGADASFSAPMSLVCMEPENHVQYRAACTAFSSGTVNYRISR